MKPKTELNAIQEDNENEEENDDAEEQKDSNVIIQQSANLFVSSLEFQVEATRYVIKQKS